MKMSRILGWLTIMIVPFAALTAYAAPMSVTPAALTLNVGQSEQLTISNASGGVRLKNSDYSKISVSLNGNTIMVTGKEVGEARLTVRDRRTSVTVPVTVTAASNPPPPVGSNTNGRLLASNCFQCHGTNGTGGFDRIAGKSESELLSELRKFATGLEGNGIMAAHATGYTDAQMQAIAKYLAAQ